MSRRKSSLSLPRGPNHLSHGAGTVPRTFHPDSILWRCLSSEGKDVLSACCSGMRYEVPYSEVSTCVGLWLIGCVLLIYMIPPTPEGMSRIQTKRGMRPMRRLCSTPTSVNGNPSAMQRGPFLG